MRDQHFIAGITEQAKKKRVGFAGAGGQEDIVDGDLGPAGAAIRSDSFAGLRESLGMRLVAQHGGIVEGLKYFVGAEIKSAFRGV